jgi:hypothetical protein
MSEREKRLERTLLDIIAQAPAKKPDIWEDDGMPVSYGNYDDCVYDGINQGLWEAAEIARGGLDCQEKLG